MQKLLEKDLVYEVVGCAMAVHNEIGHGLREKTYERAMCVEFRSREIGYTQQKSYPVTYRGVKIDEYIPDVLVEDRVIVDVKTIPRILDEERGQILNYLRVSGVRVGLILNFKHAKLEWERVVLEIAR